MSWIVRLSKPGAILAPLAGGAPGYGVFARADRRRRPVALVPEAAVKRAVSDGALTPCEAGYALTADGEARAAREQAGSAGFAAQHGEIVRRIVMEPQGERTAFARTGGPLDRYLRPHGARPALLEPVHAAAAAMLKRDYDLSALAGRVTQDWSGQPGAAVRSAPKDRAEAPARRLDAQARFLAALDAVGTGFDRLLMNVLIRETGMMAAERDLNWPERTGAPALRQALDRLTVHYRLQRGAEAAAGRREQARGP